MTSQSTLLPLDEALRTQISLSLRTDTSRFIVYYRAVHSLEQCNILNNTVSTYKLYTGSIILSLFFNFCSSFYEIWSTLPATRSVDIFYFWQKAEKRLFSKGQDDSWRHCDMQPEVITLHSITKHESLKFKRTLFYITTKLYVYM